MKWMSGMEIMFTISYTEYKTHIMCVCVHTHTYKYIKHESVEAV